MSSMQNGGVFLFIDVNNLNKINKLFGRKIGDAYIESVVRVIQNQIGEKGELFRLGGDEFAIVTSELSPHEIQALTVAIEGAVAKESQLVLKPAIQRAGQKQIKKLSRAQNQEEYENAIVSFRDDLARYARASVSVGAAYINPNRPSKTQELAEDRARIRKIQIKVNAGLSVAKYASTIEVDTTKKPSFKLDELPALIPFQSFAKPLGQMLTIGIPIIEGKPAAKGFMVLYEQPEVAVVETFDDFHRSTFWFQDKTKPKAKHRFLHSSAVTLLPSLITPEGQAFDKAFQKKSKSPRARIEFKLAGLMHFNYFKDGVESGDRALKLMGAALEVAIKNEVKSKLRPNRDLVFSAMGSDFVVFVDNVSEAVALDIQKRVLNAVANSPEIRALIDSELAMLESDPQTQPLATRLRFELDPSKLIQSNESQFRFFAGSQ